MINKFIKKRLDMYYSNKLIDEISWCFKFHNLDYKIVKEKEWNEFKIYTKKKKYKNSAYTPIIHFSYDDAIIHLIRLNETIKTVNECVSEYLKEE